SPPAPSQFACDRAADDACADDDDFECVLAHAYVAMTTLEPSPAGIGAPAPWPKVAWRRRLRVVRPTAHREPRRRLSSSVQAAAMLPAVSPILLRPQTGASACSGHRSRFRLPRGQAPA